MAWDSRAMPNRMLSPEDLCPGSGQPLIGGFCAACHQPMHERPSGSAKHLAPAWLKEQIAKAGAS